MEFRTNFFILLGLDIFWAFFQIFLVTIFFSYTDSIAGWTKYQAFFIVGFFRFVKGVFDVVIRQNLFGFSDWITRGDFDYLLTRPIDTMFLASTRYHVFSDIGSFVGGVVILIYVVPLLHVSLLQIFFMGIMATLSFVCLYSLVLLFATLAFFVTRLSAMKPYYDLISNTARFPGDIFTKGTLMGEAFLLPFIAIATIPARLITGKSGPDAVLLEFVIAVSLLIIARRFWSFALRHYSSASS